jgi:hypothetical protein
MHSSTGSIPAAFPYYISSIFVAVSDGSGTTTIGIGHWQLRYFIESALATSLVKEGEELIGG